MANELGPAANWQCLSAGGQGSVEGQADSHWYSLSFFVLSVATPHHYREGPRTLSIQKQLFLMEARLKGAEFYIKTKSKYQICYNLQNSWK